MGATPFSCSTPSVTPMQNVASKRFVFVGQGIPAFEVRANSLEQAYDFAYELIACAVSDEVLTLVYEFPQ